MVALWRGLISYDRLRRTSKWLALLVLVSGCTGVQSVLDPKGPAAQTIVESWWLMFWGAWAIFALVIVLALYAVYRRPERYLRISSVKLIIAGGVVLPVVILSALLIYGIAMSNVLRGAIETELLRIRVVGNQWWWEVYYPDAMPGQTVITANEIHIPVGRPVEVAVTTRDVIHSFWVPNLAGKIDLMPGRVNTVRIQADTPGRFRGQCAEFCGAQHARMAFWVVAQPEQDFMDWVEQQRRPAREPDTQHLVQGREAFLTVGCSDCHTIRGTAATGLDGPDLTHVGSRMTLAAGTLDNNFAALAAWIANSQTIKPGNRMEPFQDLKISTLLAITSYLESLE